VHRYLPPLARELTKKSSLFSLADFALKSNLSPEECAEALAAFVASGVLRKTMTDDGEVYYWLVKDPTEKKAAVAE
jgi:hypothetical protein